MDSKIVQAAKLRVLLATIEDKYDRGIPLTPNEENLLAECQRVRYLKPTKEMVVDHDGNVTVARGNDAEPIMQAMHEFGGLLGKKINKSNGGRMIGAVDPVTAQIWSQQSGLKIGTREFAQYAKKKLADIDFRKFRVGG